MTGLSRGQAWELGIEFLAELLLFSLPYGADQMGLPHNFWLDLVCWGFAVIVFVRMFWIFPLWAARLSRLEKGLMSFIAVSLFVLIFYKPVLTAYERHETDSVSTPAAKGQDQAGKVPNENAPTNLPTAKQIPDAPPPKKPPPQQFMKSVEPRTDAPVSSGPCSNIQIGGTQNTAATNCLPPSRVLSDDAAQSFALALSASKRGMLRVVLASSSDDVFPLAEQLCAAAESVNWGTSCPNSRYATMGRDVSVNGLACYSENWDAEDAVAFREAMRITHLQCNYIPRAYSFGGLQIGGTGGVTILIGSPVQP
ncbi:MAG: hypothetical protein WAK78_04505 [Candidatus Acidiferrales bacterium]